MATSPHGCGAFGFPPWFSGSNLNALPQGVSLRPLTGFTRVQRGLSSQMQFFPPPCLDFTPPPHSNSPPGHNLPRKCDSWGCARTAAAEDSEAACATCLFGRICKQCMSVCVLCQIYIYLYIFIYLFTFLTCRYPFVCVFFYPTQSFVCGFVSWFTVT